MPLSKKQAHLSAEIKKLVDGNNRFQKGTFTHTISLSRERKKLVLAQKPFACVICCSDSRVPPEIIFDQRLGKLFVVRCAGNVVDSLGLASIEYAITALGVDTIMVLGHENCGAVQAALNEQASYSGHIPELIKQIKPAVEKAKKMEGTPLVNAICENVKTVMSLLKTSKPTIGKAFDESKLAIVGGYYTLKDGKVSLIS